MLPALALQLLLRREPEWRSHPVAVVDADKPQGKILQVDERAYRNAVRAGQRYAAGLALCAGLRAGVVPAVEITAATDELVVAMRRFSPAIEPAPTEWQPGVFWLDVHGLAGVFESPDAWSEQLAERLRELGWRGAVVVGFDRFRCHALALAHAGTGRARFVCATSHEELERTDAVPLARLPIDPKLRDALDRLGVTDVGDLRALPTGGLLARFGAEGDRLQALARGGVGGGTGSRGLIDSPEPERFVATFELDPEQPSIDLENLLAVMQSRLEDLIGELAVRGEAIAELRLELRLDRNGGARSTALEPAEATLDIGQLLELLRLRLTMFEFPEPVVAFELELGTVAASREQLEMYGAGTRRDLRAANRALARVRAELGDDAVVHAQLRPGHMPEAEFVWRPLAKLERAVENAVDVLFSGGCADEARDGNIDGGRLVRRLLTRPRAVRGPDSGPVGDGWFAGGARAGAVCGSSGPFVVSGGWWRRQSVHRVYHFVETQRGDVLWIFEDRVLEAGDRRRWFLHGVVE